MQAEAVLRKILPSKTEALGVKRLAESTRKSLGKHLPPEAKTLLAGSVAKGTFLKGAGDIDLFAIFPFSYSKEEMFKSLEKAAKKAFPGARMETGYAEHPYLRIYLKGKRLDLVPSYKMEPGERVKSAVDRSQLHTPYILSNMKPAQRKEVLLLKQFLKANLLYGAEIKTKGFSGYLCELIVLQYGSFRGALKEVSRWKPPLALDPEKHYKTARAIPDFNAPLTVIDPVDRTRNVAAVITQENLRRLISLSAAYLSRPSEEFFFPRAQGKKELAKKMGERGIFAFCFPKPKTGLVSQNLAEDVLWGQIWRLSGQLESFLKKAEFVVLGIRPYATDSEILVLLELRSPVLPREQVFRGPFLGQAEHVSVFMRKRKGPFFFEHGRINAQGERKLWNISLAIKEFKMKGPFPSYLRPATPDAKLLGPESLLEDYQDALMEYFRLSWFSKT